MPIAKGRTASLRQPSTKGLRAPNGMASAGATRRLGPNEDAPAQAELAYTTYTWGIEAPLLHPDRTRTNSFFSPHMQAPKQRIHANTNHHSTRVEPGLQGSAHVGTDLASRELQTRGDHLQCGFIRDYSPNLHQSRKPVMRRH